MSIDLTPGMPGGEVHLIVLIWLLSGVLGTSVFIQLTRKYYGDWSFSRRHHLSLLRCSVSQQALENCLARLAATIIVIGTGLYTLLTEVGLPALPFDAATDPIAPWIAIIPWLMVIQGLREYRHEVLMLTEIDSERDTYTG